MPSSPDSTTGPDSRANADADASVVAAFVDNRDSNVAGRAIARVAVSVVLLGLLTGVATASNGMTLSKQSREALAVPTWLYLATGAAAIGASGLLAGFVTDRAFIRSVHEWSRPGLTVPRGWHALARVGQGLAVLVLGLMVFVGLTGPQLPAASLTVLLTFVVARAALPMVTYLGGNLWPLVNPWQALVAPFPTGLVAYPDRLQRWPAVAGLLSIVWVEVIFPVSTVPRVLAWAIVGYSVYTVAGALLFGADAWFQNADPLSVLFRLFGAVAPFQWENGTLSVTLPGNELVNADLFTDASDVAFVVGLIWELTFSGFITTTVGAATIEAFVNATDVGLLGAQARASIVYTGLLLGGFVVFVAAYWYASVLSCRHTGTYLTARRIALRFGPALLAIAAGYHLAHYLGLAVSLSPALGMVVTSPLAPPANPLTLAVPGWFDALDIAFVLVGHVFAIWAAHAIAYDEFASRLVAIRSQYPFIAVMVGYTVISLWVLSLPGATPPYLP